MEISNFYTATIYNKGAELIRMMKTILGPDKFRAGTDLYFERHDGQAVTCDDFVKAMEDASGVDLAHFRLWYSQAGTPQVRARIEHDSASGTAVLHLAQSVPPTPGQPVKKPMAIPLRTALIGEESGAEIAPERLILLEEPEQTVTFEAVREPPLLSINRDFSAPVLLQADRRPGELEKLAASDMDPFARYEAIQELMLGWLIAETQAQSPDAAPAIEAVANTLRSNALDAAFKAEAILLPIESMIGDRMEAVDPEAIHAARKKLQKQLLTGIGRSAWKEVWESNSDAAYELTPEAKSRRRLKNVALDYLMAEHTEDSIGYSSMQYRRSTNMTDRLAALKLLSDTQSAARTEALADFYSRYEQDPLVIDKWFAVQASAQRPDTVEQVRQLLDHAAFSVTNPNRLRSIAAYFGSNQWAFHSASGEGYRLLADLILAADKVNPQVAARQLPPLGRWRRFDEKRAAMMRAELERIVATSGLSKDVYEQASKSLA